MDSEDIKAAVPVAVDDRRDLTKASSSVKRGLPKYWSRDYIERCLQGVNHPMHRMLFMVLWTSGVRISEALGLRKRDLDFENFTFTVRWLKSRRYETRVVPMHPRLRDSLFLFTATRTADEELFPFTRQRAHQLTRRYFDGHPHQFRHSFAVHWLRSGADFVTLHRMLGHAKVQTTMVYLRIVPVDQGRELLKVPF